MVGVLCLSQQCYFKKVVECFSIHESKPVDTLLGHHIKLSITQSSSSEKGRKEMKTIPYANGVGNITYAFLSCLKIFNIYHNFLPCS